MKKGKVLKLYENRAIFDSLDSGNCILAIQTKEGIGRELQITDKSHLREMGTPCQTIQFESIFGFYGLLSGTYIALVLDSEPYVNVPNIEIRKAKKISILPLFRNSRPLSEVKQNDENRYLELLHLAFSEHNFFYSSKSHITLTQQTQALLNSRQKLDPLWTHADQRFFWNRDVIIDLIAIDADEWIVPFMSAYIEVQPECDIEGEKFILLLVSRRSRYRQGCRFTRRGIDEGGNAANFVETEQILIFPNERVTSYVQIRGSIPTHWASPVTMKYEPPVHLNDDLGQCLDRAERHVQDIYAHYASDPKAFSLAFVNLIDKKKDQNRLGVGFGEVVEGLAPRFVFPLHYIWFDFHAECKKKGKWNNLSRLVSQVKDLMSAQSYFCKVNGSITSLQTGLLRTNCMDNLDRTNVVQSLFARRSLLMQFGRKDMLDSDAYVLDSKWKAFEKTYKSMWVNNANSMSLSYAGTGALKVDFTKTGKRTFKGMWNDGVNSCMRYYFNNFTDGAKQDAIDLLVGNYQVEASAPSPFADRPDQDSLPNAATKAFVLLMAVFSSLLLITPRSAPIPGETDRQTWNLTISLAATFFLLIYTIFVVVKKGSPIGARLVMHPKLLPDSLPTSK